MEIFLTQCTRGFGKRFPENVFQNITEKLPFVKRFEGEVGLLDLRWLCCKKETDLVGWEEKNTSGSIMTEQHPFNWRHVQPDLIWLCVR